MAHYGSIRTDSSGTENTINGTRLRTTKYGSATFVSRRPGTEFVRRLTELGDWQSAALERLNAKFEVGESLSSEEQHQAKPLAKLPAKSR